MFDEAEFMDSLFFAMISRMIFGGRWAGLSIPITANLLGFIYNFIYLFVLFIIFYAQPSLGFIQNGAIKK